MPRYRAQNGPCGNPRSEGKTGTLESSKSDSYIVRCRDGNIFENCMHSKGVEGNLEGLELSRGDVSRGTSFLIHDFPVALGRSFQAFFVASMAQDHFVGKNGRTRFARSLYPSALLGSLSATKSSGRASPSGPRVIVHVSMYFKCGFCFVNSSIMLFTAARNPAALSGGLSG